MNGFVIGLLYGSCGLVTAGLLTWHGFLDVDDKGDLLIMAIVFLCWPCFAAAAVLAFPLIALGWFIRESIITILAIYRVIRK